MVYLVENEPGARIKVIGAGGCGGNAINHMIASGLQNVEFVAVNTDSQALRNNTASIQLQIGQMLTRGRGAGGFVVSVTNVDANLRTALPSIPPA